MKSLDDIKRNGFFPEDDLNNLSFLSLLSLRIALKSYFSTYSSIRHFIHLFAEDSDYDDQIRDKHCNPEYIEAASETVVHFQHFAELFFKDILRDEHPVLAINTNDKHVILHKLLRDEKVTPSDYNNLNSPEFSSVHQRVYALLDKNRLGTGQFAYLLKYKKALSDLGELRNRICHRGRFVLRYSALDDLVLNHLLPFVYATLQLPQFNEKEYFWKYKRLTCSYDPFSGLLSDCNQPYDVRKIAFKKELGRAAYYNPFTALEGLEGIAKQFDAEKRNTIERAAVTQIDAPNIYAVKKCPVCGAKALIVHDDIEPIGEDPEKGTYEKLTWYTWKVNCVCCTFELLSDIKNPSVYSLPIEDFWEYKES